MADLKFWEDWISKRRGISSNGRAPALHEGGTSIEIFKSWSFVSRSRITKLFFFWWSDSRFGARGPGFDSRGGPFAVEVSNLYSKLLNPHKHPCSPPLSTHTNSQKRTVNKKKKTWLIRCSNHCRGTKRILCKIFGSIKNKIQ